MDRNPNRETHSQAWESSRGGDAAACSFVRHLLSLGRSLRIYQQGHGRVHENAAALRSVAEELLFGRAESLDFVVDGKSMRVGGEVLRSEPAVAETFAEVLRARGISALVLHAGVDRAELMSLAELLGGDAKDMHRSGGLGRALDDVYHPHFDLIETSAMFRGATGADAEGEAHAGAPAGMPVLETHCSLEVTATFDDLLGSARELPQELESEDDVADEDRTLVYTTFAGGEAGKELGKLSGIAEATLRDDIAAHSVEQGAALAIFDMLGRATDEMEYRVRRDLVEAVVRDRRIEPRALRVAQLHLVGELPNWPHENPAGLLLELCAVTGDLALMESAFSRSDMTRVAAQGVAEQLAARDDAFDALTNVVRGSLPDRIRLPMEDALMAAARDRKLIFRRWAVENPGRVMHRTVLPLLLQKAELALTPVVKEFFTRGDDKVRNRMVDALVREGSQKALRLVLHGVKGAGDLRDPYVIAALGGFRHGLAVDVLRDVVERCNTDRFDLDQASAAIIALSENGTDEALGYLEQVASGKRMFLKAYKRPLRELAAQMLETV